MFSTLPGWRCRRGLCLAPEGVEALEALVAHKDVLHGLVHGVAHVQLTGDVWRRNDDGERWLRVVVRRRKQMVVFPEFIPAVFNLG